MYIYARVRVCMWIGVSDLGLWVLWRQRERMMEEEQEVVEGAPNPG